MQDNVEKINNTISVLNWTKSDVSKWAKCEHLSNFLDCIEKEEIDGKTLLHFCEQDVRDLRDKYCYKLKISDIKKFWIATRSIQKENQNELLYWGITDSQPMPIHNCQYPIYNYGLQNNDYTNYNDVERFTPPLSIDGKIISIKPEVFKTMVGLCYSFLVTWITAFVMVVVHERVPDMQRYPPLPDIFLDNVPHIPWAFSMCEITGTLLFLIWASVCIVHKYRLVILRRFFALAGTVFLLRCVTMLITSLSVPGTHLQCHPNDYKVDDTNLTLGEAFHLRVSRAYAIWSGLGMSIQGVRTCGDYMFSGHTVALTLLNFFITEYTPRNLYFLHTLTWLLNMFGIFFILAAHEHYSIDVFVAFYITSRLFLYYHTLANNQALMSRDSTRTRIWFPMFSYFESTVDGIIPNEYDSIGSLCGNLFSCIVYIKDTFMLTARRFWVVPNQLQPFSEKIMQKKSEKSNNSSPHPKNSPVFNYTNISNNILSKKLRNSIKSNKNKNQAKVNIQNKGENIFHNCIGKKTDKAAKEK